MRHFALLLFVITAATACCRAQTLSNADFAKWSGDLPSGWTAEIGAQNGDGSLSKIARLDPQGVSLAGDATTRRWQILEQEVTLRKPGTYRLTFVARAVDVRREGRQFDNCYVGVSLPSPGGKPKFVVAAVTSPEFSESQIAFQANDDATSVQVLIFLSKSGALEIRKVSLEALGGNASFQVLIDDMGRNYSFLDAKGIDWPALTEKHRKAAEAAGSPEAFAKVIARMLGELKDLHVTIRLADGKELPTFRRKYTGNYDLSAVAKSLQDVERFEPEGFVGRTSEGYGYVAITSLSGDEQVFEKLLAATRARFDAPALVIDLRACNGGDERRAQAIAALLNDEPRVYARTLIRSGPKPGDLQEMPPRELAASDEPYTNPVIALIGPGCVSSGEGFAQMLAVLPHCTLVGQPTAGASGNPAPIELPNGVTVMYSRWVDWLPDGTPLEGHGVPPDVVVAHKRAAGKDVTFEAAVEAARKAVEVSK